MKKNIPTQQQKINEIEKFIKPNYSSLIIITLVCLGPYGHLILNIVSNEYDKLLKSALLTFPTLVLLGIYWSWHITHMKNYKEIIKN